MATNNRIISINTNMTIKMFASHNRIIIKESLARQCYLLQRTLKSTLERSPRAQSRPLLDVLTLFLFSMMGTSAPFELVVLRTLECHGIQCTLLSSLECNGSPRGFANFAPIALI